MTVISSKEQFLERRGQLLSKFEWELTRVWDVVTNNANDDPYTVLTTATSASPDPIATVNSHHPTNDSAICRNVTCDPAGDHYKAWRVVATYDNKTNEDSSGGSPEARALEISMSTVQYDSIVETDIFGLPIVNSCQEEFDEPLLKDDCRLQLTIVAQRLSYDGGTLSSFINTVNSGVFYGGAIGTVKFQDFQMQPVVENNLFFWKHTYTFQYDRYGWKRKILDRGLRHRENADPLEIPKKNNPFIVMNLLPTGQLLQTGAPLQPPLEFTIYESRDFSLLGVGG